VLQKEIDRSFESPIDAMINSTVGILKLLLVNPFSEINLKERSLYQRLKQTNAMLSKIFGYITYPVKLSALLATSINMLAGILCITPPYLLYCVAEFLFTSNSALCLLTAPLWITLGTAGILSGGLITAAYAAVGLTIADITLLVHGAADVLKLITLAIATPFVSIAHFFLKDRSEAIQAARPDSSSMRIQNILLPIAPLKQIQQKSGMRNTTENTASQKTWARVSPAPSFPRASFAFLGNQRERSSNEDYPVAVCTPSKR